MDDTDLGEATITYEGPDGDTVETTVENEHLAYFQDHWMLKTEEQDDHDVVRRIPAQRVYHVERSVEEFEEEVGTILDDFEREVNTLRDAVRSVTDELPAGLFGGGGERRERSESDVTRIDIEDPDDAGGVSGDDTDGVSDDDTGEFGDGGS